MAWQFDKRKEYICYCATPFSIFLLFEIRDRGEGGGLGGTTRSREKNRKNNFVLSVEDLRDLKLIIFSHFSISRIFYYTIFLLLDYQNITRVIKLKIEREEHFLPMIIKNKQCVLFSFKKYQDSSIT